MVYQGVYESHNKCLKKVPLISLNELSADPHNAYFKLFASQKKEREKAFKILGPEGLPSLPEPLESLLSGLRLLKGEQDMSLELTPEQVRNMGRTWGKRYLSTLPQEDRKAYLETVPLEERLASTPPTEVMNYFNSAERMAGLSVEEIEAYLKTLKKPKKRQKVVGNR